MISDILDSMTLFVEDIDPDQEIERRTRCSKRPRSSMISMFEPPELDKKITKSGWYLIIWSGQSPNRRLDLQS